MRKEIAKRQLIIALVIPEEDLGEFPTLKLSFN